MFLPVRDSYCAVHNLYLSNPTIATSRLGEDERAKFNLGRQGDGTIINESGLYSLHSEAFKGLRHKVHSISLFFGGVTVRDSLCFKKLLVDEPSTTRRRPVDAGKDRIG